MLPGKASGAKQNHASLSNITQKQEGKVRSIEKKDVKCKFMDHPNFSSEKGSKSLALTSPQCF